MFVKCCSLCSIWYVMSEIFRDNTYYWKIVFLVGYRKPNQVSEYINISYHKYIYIYLSKNQFFLIFVQFFRTFIYLIKSKLRCKNILIEIGEDDQFILSYIWIYQISVMTYDEEKYDEAFQFRHQRFSLCIYVCFQSQNSH